MLRTAAAVLLACAFLAAAAPSVPGSAASDFEALLEDVDGRIEELAGTTDREGRKRLKSLEKAAALLAKPDAALGIDLKSLGKAAKGLAKAYPEEFAAEPPGGSLGERVDGILEGIRQEIGSELFSMEYEEDYASLAGEARIQAAIARARTALDADAGGSRTRLVALLAKALKEGRKAAKVFDTDPGPHPGLVVTIDGVPYLHHATGVLLARNEGGSGTVGRLSLVAVRHGFPAADFHFMTDPVLGTGTVGFYQADFGIAGLLPAHHVMSPAFPASSGSLTVTAIDLEAKTISLTFTITLVDQVSGVETMTITGSYTGEYAPTS